MVITTPERRGAEVFASDLAVALDGLGVDADLVALMPTGSQGALDVEVLAATRWNVRGLARLARLARTYDLLIAHGGDTLIPTTVAAATARRPFVYRNVGDPSVWGSTRLAGLRLGVPLRRARSVAALYDTAADHFESHHRVARRRIAVIPNAAPARRFTPVTESERSRLRTRLGLDDGRVWVAMVGALSPEKRPLLAIDAVASDERLGLLVVGDGSQRAECSVAAAGATHGNVRMLGVSDDVAAIYGAVDVVVIPSRTEGMPAAAIEAGMRGVPVVATDVGGMAHVVVHGVTGLLVTEPTPATLRDQLLLAAGRRDELGPAASSWCHDRFAMDVVARRWRDLIEESVDR